ncbi:hypothetical protein [Streptosporangium sp. NPDC002607]
MSKGLYVSFLGVDGIGKTTLAGRLARTLEDSGLPVRQVSWRGALDTPGPAWPHEALQQLWLETFRLLYGGARSEGEWLSLPRDYRQWRDDGWEPRLEELPLEAARPSGPLAATLAELAGNLILADEVIRPALRRGEIVIQETFPFKHVLKEILIGRRLVSGNGEWEGVAKSLESLVTDFFGSPPLRPDLGVLVDGPVDLAYRWRMSQTGRLSLLEDYGAAGERGMESFRALQEETAGIFRSVARRWGWVVHRVDDSGLEPNMRRGVDLILDQPRLREIGGRGRPSGERDVSGLAHPDVDHR